MIYTYARLGRGDLGFCRLFGEGLGNTLLPWARSMVAARRGGFTEIWPAWRQIFHRGGWRDVWREARGDYGLKNLRNYDALFQPASAQLTGWPKLAALLRGRRVDEAEYLRRGAHHPWPEGSVIVFDGLSDTFEDLRGEHEFLRARLWERTAAGIRARLDPQTLAGAIGVHVRLGDFPSRTLEGVRQVRHNSRLPLSWYTEKIRQVRAALGGEWPVLVFSDGLDHELAEVLALPGARRVSYGSALADLWAMSFTGVMVCSLSTMNKWSCYLGRPPVIRLRGVMYQPLYLDEPAAEIESDLGEALPEGFAGLVRRRAAGG